MAMKFIEVTDSSKVKCTLDWLISQPFFRGQPKSIGRTLNNNLQGNPRTYITIHDGMLGSTNVKPIGIEIKVNYKLAGWVVASYEEARETIEFQGKRYYVDELEEALRGCEVK